MTPFALLRYLQLTGFFVGVALLRQVMLQKEVALKAEAAGHALRLTALLLHYCASLSVKRIEEVDKF